MNLFERRLTNPWSISIALIRYLSLRSSFVKEPVPGQSLKLDHQVGPEQVL